MSDRTETIFILSGVAGFFTAFVTLSALTSGSPDFVDSMICRNMGATAEQCGKFLGLTDKTTTENSVTGPRYK